MATKLKNFYKLKVCVITLTVLLPAILLVALYPQMERAMLEVRMEQLSTIGEYDRSLPMIYVEIGAPVVVLIAAIVVAIVALLLPLCKRLHTGWERLFSMPFIVIVGLTIAGISGAVGMFYAMSVTNRLQIREWAASFQFLGYNPTVDDLYGWLRVLNVLGWALLFFAEYIVVASLRQLLCRPKEYIRNRIFLMKMVAFIRRKCEDMCREIREADLSKNLRSVILKVVLVNFIVLSLCCAMWFFGVLGLLIYSGVLYVLICKYVKKLQTQYESVQTVAQEMANGNLKAELDEDLGVFQSIGTALETVQLGFQKAVVEEAKSQNMKTELIANVSHDLKTPLTAMITYVDLLKKEGITEAERRSYVEILDQKSQRLKVLIEDLFEVSKAQSGTVQMNLMELDIVRLMKQVKSEMEDAIEQSNLTFRWNLPEEKVILRLDGQRTYRVFENLLNNAIKYAMPHTRVYVDLMESETEVSVMFRNISAVELDCVVEDLTERFVRGDKSRTSEGSGLGLAIAKSFVELQGGIFQIQVDGDLFKATIVWKK